jgi:hypothetical protein
MRLACWRALFALSSVCSLMLVAGIANAEWPLGGLRIAQPAELVHTIPTRWVSVVFWRRPGNTGRQRITASGDFPPGWPDRGGPSSDRA